MRYNHIRSVLNTCAAYDDGDAHKAEAEKQGIIKQLAADGKITEKKAKEEVSLRAPDPHMHPHIRTRVRICMIIMILAHRLTERFLFSKPSRLAVRTQAYTTLT